MNRILYRILTVLMAFIVLGFLAYQVIRYLYMPVQTETAYLFTQADYVPADGIAIREETVITTPSSGVKSYLYNDGDKVSLGMPVAEIYTSQQDAANEAAIRKLEQEIVMLKQASDPARADYANAEVLNSQITDKLTHLSEVAESRSLGSLNTYKNEYLMLLNMRQIATDRVENFEPRITQLTAQAESLKSGTQTSLAEVAAPAPGFYVSKTDGFEGKLTHDDVLAMPVDSFKQLLQQKDSYQPADNVVGKVITDFEWYFAATIPAENMGRFTPGAAVTITFNDVSDEGYSALVSDTALQDGAKEGHVVFKLNRMDKELCTLRCERAEIAFKTYRGLKVRNTVMRFQGNQPGVYVKNGDSIRFKKLEIIYYGDGFVLSREREEEDYLGLYNEMLVNGKELNTTLTK